ncbi:hypothetical protein Syn7502_03146 [Synechococcus sp. PCC 7502]|uniref:hypothetical protein n=1 Tax=Synechococcus sp. PCC 7502 TaxID=1173263 RepID=UPI00029FBDEC|nr:hypothetical protein [Synechococcus sp. PCC 7502]AFY75039.1 hypothetical protein Syn7502_03146 [Synechococcus sp. PCC 7502]
MILTKIKFSLGIALTSIFCAGVAAAEICEPLSPQVSPTQGKTVRLTIGPTLGFGSHGNTYFLIPRPISTVTVKLTPITIDKGAYPTQLIARYSDDTIFESGAPIFVPDSTKPIIWGPLEVNQPGKVLDVFNVKILENYRLYPQSQGFTYDLEVTGCR